MATLGNTTATQLKVINDLDVTKVFAPTASNGTTLGAGSNGQVLTSNGTTVYWKTPAAGLQIGTTATTAAAGNHTHSGYAASTILNNLDFSDPTASGTSTSFIATVSETDGLISATKKNLPTASTSVAGIIKIGTTANDAAAGNHTHSAYLTSSSTLDATKLSGTIPASCYTDTNTTYSFADTYNASTNKGATVATVTNAINALDVSAPTASSTTSTTFVDTISQTDGKISATIKTLPTASSSVAGITKVGATGGAAAYSHSHSTYITKPTEGTNGQVLTTDGAGGYTWKTPEAGGSTVSYTNTATTGSTIGTLVVNGTSYTLKSGVVDTNTDTKVTQTASTTAGAKPIILAYGTSTATNTTFFDTDVTVNPGDGTLNATKYTVQNSTVVATKTSTGGWLWS